MGELIYFPNKNSGLLSQYVKSIVDASGLVKDLDFHIFSMIVMDNEYDTYSFGGFLGKPSNKLLQGCSDFLEQAKNHLKEQGKDEDILWIAHTQYVDNCKVVFYKIEDEIDIDLATEIGLGVVSNKGELLIYSPEADEDSVNAVNEMVRLKVYLQLLHPERVDIKLKESYEKNSDLIQSLLLINNWSYMERLEKIFGY